MENFVIDIENEERKCRKKTLFAIEMVELNFDFQYKCLPKSNVDCFKPYACNYDTNDHQWYIKSHP